MKKPERVRDVVRPVPELGRDETVEGALEKMRQAKADVAVVPGGERRYMLVTMEQLQAAEPSVRTEALDLHHPVIVDADERLEHVAGETARELVLRPRLPGVLVVSKENLLGLVPRSVLADLALTASRSGADRLEGAPIDTLVFECPVDGERRVIGYYDRSNPPRCADGHPMQLVV